jgi:hypothetical protein
MEVDARIEADRETVYMLSGIRKSYYDFLMEMDGQKQSEPEDAVGKFAVPYSENASFAVLSWDERSEGVSVENAAPELADAVLTHSYPIHTGFAFRDGKDAIVSVKRGRLLIIVSRKFTSNPR